MGEQVVAGNNRRSWRRDIKIRPREGDDPDSNSDFDSDEFAAGSGNSFDSPLLFSWFEKKSTRLGLPGASKRRTLLLVKMVVVSGIIYALYLLFWAAGTSRAGPCRTVDQGYQCFTPTSRLWGQYSPYFAVKEEAGLSSSVPDGCNVTFVQVLSRHGARFPTSSKSAKYAELIEAIQHNATSFNGEAAFLKTFQYTLGADDLVPFGEAQMVDSGIKFYERYRDLARDIVPFVRSSGSDRVIASGERFIEGFQRAKSADSLANQTQSTPVINVILEETPGFNNTLDHSVCTEFEDDNGGHKAKANFTDLFVPSIKSRLEASLPGVNLSNTDVISLMDICPFETVGKTPDASVLSPFCTLFTQDEWIKYDYLQSLDKYYANAAGNPLGPAQGIGFTNELIARLTQTPVHDETSTNRTLDSDPATFPLNSTLYADFSHDNSMIGIFFALGLYNGTAPLSLTRVETVEQMDGYSAAWTVPFGARAYVETMQCRSVSDRQPTVQEPLVRVLVNDRVVPLHGCEVDALGRCRLTDFVDGLSFARSGGNWGSCYR